SEKWASQPLPGRAQWSVGSIDDDGIRYGLITHALIASTIATAPTIVTTQSIAIRVPRDMFRVSRSIGLWGGRGAGARAGGGVGFGAAWGACTRAGAAADEATPGLKPDGSGRSVESYSARRSGSESSSYASWIWAERSRPPPPSPATARR